MRSFSAQKWGQSDPIFHKNYREVRKELVHEKPVPLSMDKSPICVAQEEAARAVRLMHRIIDEALAERAT